MPLFLLFWQFTGGNEISTQMTHQSNETIILIQYRRQKKSLLRYFTLGGFWKVKYTEQATITAFQRIFHFGRVFWSWKAKYTEQATITAFQRIFHFGRVYLSWKANTYIRAERTSNKIALRKYFTLGGCFGCERPIYRTSYNNRKIFHFRRVYWSWKANTYIRAERTSKRIALKKYFTLGGCFGSERPNIQNKLQYPKKYFTLGGCFGLERSNIQNKLQ